MDLMRIDSKKVFDSTNTLLTFSNGVSFHVARVPNVPFTLLRANHDELVTAEANLREQAALLGMQSTLPRLDFLRTFLAELKPNIGALRIQNQAFEGVQLPPVKLTIFQRYLEDIANRVQDDLNCLAFLHLRTDAIEYFDNPISAFGEQVWKSFPYANYEIEEACKCIALARSTAAVFHLMRIMEVSITALAKCLDIPDPVRDQGKTWGAISQTINVELKARAAGHPRPWKNAADKEFFGEIYILMDAVRGVWRNKTMHPGRTYSLAEANEIFFAVKTFMRKISARLNESGQPLA